MVEVAEINCPDSWPETMKEEVRVQTDTAQAYEMVIRICED